MAIEIHKGDAGTVFRVTVVEQDPAKPTNPNAKVPVDISGATLLAIIFREPGADGKALGFDATLTGDGTDGRMEYAAEPGVLSKVGSWKIQGRVVMADGDIFSSEVAAFPVHANIEDEVDELVLHPEPVAVAVTLPAPTVVIA